MATTYKQAYDLTPLSGTTVLHGGGITPAPPSWTFSPDTRILTLSHATLGASELEFSYQNAAYQQYVAGLSVDAASHPAGDWKGRVKAATGRNASQATGSPALAATATPGQKFILANEGDSTSSDNRERYSGDGNGPLKMDVTKAWPGYLQDILAAAGQSQYVGFLNYATPGDLIAYNHMLHPAEIAEVKDGVAALTASLTQAGSVVTSFLFIWAGINNIHAGGTGQGAYDYYKILSHTYNQANPAIQTVAMTLMATRINTAGFTETQLQGFWQQVQIFNALLRAGHYTECGSPVCIDVQSHPAFSGYDAPLNERYYQPDHLHENEFGHYTLAKFFAQALPQIIAGTVGVVNWVDDGSLNEPPFNQNLLSPCVASDTFSREGTNELGVAEKGGAWIPFGNASVAPTGGMAKFNSSNGQPRSGAVLNVNKTVMKVQGRATLDDLIDTLMLIGNYVDPSNYWFAYVGYIRDQVGTLGLYQVAGGVNTKIGPSYALPNSATDVQHTITLDCTGTAVRVLFNGDEAIPPQPFTPPVGATMAGIGTAGGFANWDDFSVQTDGGATGSTYAIPNANISDNNLNQPDTQGVMHNTFASFAFTTAATQVSLPLYAPIMGTYGGSLGVVVNGTEVSLPLTVGSVNQELAIPNLPAGTNTIKIIIPASLRPGGMGAIISDNVLSVKANAAVTFLPAETAAYEIKIFGDSISCSGTVTHPAFEGFNLVMRKKYAALGPEVRITNRTASADSLAEQYGFKDAAGKAAFIQELGQGLNTPSGSTLLIAIGTNDKGVKGRSDAQFIADYTGLVDDFHAAFPSVLVVAMTPLLRTDGQDLAGYRAGILALRDSRPQWLEVLSGPDMLPAGAGYLNADGLHPTTLGHSVLADNLFYALRYHTGAYVSNSTSGPNSFTEQFDTPTRNAALWNEGYMGYVGPGATVAQAGNALQITATFGPGHQNGYTSVLPYDMTGGKAFYGKILSLFRPVDTTTMNLFVGKSGGGVTNTIGIGLLNRTLRFSGENFQPLYEMPYNASVHTYWRLLEENGALLGQTSADNTTWTTQYTWLAPSFPLSSVQCVVSGGSSDVAPAGETNQSIGTASWDFVKFG